MRAQEWREVAKKQRDPFIKFTVEYLAFNALCRGKYGYRKSDKDMIDDLKNEIPFQVISTEKINELKDLAPIENVRKKYYNRKYKLTRDDLDDPKNVITAVYWVRNNLFHGDKQYSFERDQKLVKIAYEILVNINDWLLKSLED